MLSTPNLRRGLRVQIPDELERQADSEMEFVVLDLDMTRYVFEHKLTALASFQSLSLAAYTCIFCYFLHLNVATGHVSNALCALDFQLEGIDVIWRIILGTRPSLPSVVSNAASRRGRHGGCGGSHELIERPL